MGLFLSMKMFQHTCPKKKYKKNKRYRTVSFRSEHINVVERETNIN